jgi:hypothetical protein
MDYRYSAYIGYNPQNQSANYETLWNDETLKLIQSKITDLLQGVDKNGRPIIVPTKTIASVMTNVSQSSRPNIGSIYSTYIQESKPTRNDSRDIISRTIETIVSQIRNEYETIENNQKLSIWSTLYGDFNKEGLRQHPEIKLNNRKYQPMLFQMRY